MTAPSRPAALAAGQAVTGPGTFRGLAVRETGGVNPVVVQLFDNTAGSGILLATLRLVAFESRDIDLGDGARFDKGIFVVFTGTGAAEGSLRLA